MNAVIYARYSSHSQSEQSIEGQLRDNYAWARRNNVTVIGEYIDRALTATSDRRPDFQRMIRDAAKRQFQLVIVWKLDRFARNRYDSADYKARLKRYGVRVVSVNEAIADGPEGIIMEGLLESMAEYYSANLSQNIRRGQRETLAKGRFVGGKAPYGYKHVDGKLIPDEKTAPIIRYVFEQYAAGVPKKEIYAELNARGIRNSNGKPLGPTSFAEALANPVYIGKYTYSGTVVPGVSTPLIDETTFEKVQRITKFNARTPGKAKSSVVHLLQGRAFCAYCGAPLVGESGRSRNGEVHYYYACADKKKSHSCHKKNEKKDPLEEYVVDRTLRFILSPARASRVARAVVAQYKKEFSDSRVDELARAVSQLEKELNKLVDALIDAPKAAHSRIYARMEQLEAQKADLAADLAKLRVAQEIQLTEPEVLAWLKSFHDSDPADPDIQQRIIDTFVNSVYLWEDRIVIFYNLRPAASTDSAPQITFQDLPQAAPAQLASSEAQKKFEPGSPGSNLYGDCGAKPYKFEPTVIFVRGVYGLIFERDPA